VIVRQLLSSRLGRDPAFRGCEGQGRGSPRKSRNSFRCLKRVFENLSRDRFRAGSSLKTYIFQISKYTCIEFLRRKIRASAVDIESVELRDHRPGPEQEAASAEWAEKAADAVESLSKQCRELFEMIFIEHLPYQDIGRKLGIAEGTVKSRTWRCREQLAKKLRKKGVV
jgi:RNA polymerase sigma factor (sigma-70 family)